MSFNIIEREYMNSILAILVQVLSNSHIQDVNYDIALALYENFNSIPKLSSTELASLCHVSVPRLNKFLKTVGYMDVSTFRKMCIANQELFSYQFSYRYPKFDSKKIGQSLYTLSTAQTLEQFMQLDTLNNIVDHIENSNRILIYGSAEIADLFSTFQSFFTFYNKPVLINTIQTVDNLIPEKDGDFHFICTLSGRLLKLQPDLYSRLCKLSNSYIITALPFPGFPSLRIFSDSEIFESYYFISFYLDCIKHLYWQRMMKYADWKDCGNVCPFNIQKQ